MPRACSARGSSAYVRIRQHTSAYVSIIPESRSRPEAARPSRLEHASLVQRSRQQRIRRRSQRASWLSLRRWRVRQHADAYVSIRQHTSAYVSIRQRMRPHADVPAAVAGTSACGRIRQHTSAYAYDGGVREPAGCLCGGGGYVSMRTHTSAYVSIRQHTSAYVSVCVRMLTYLRRWRRGGVSRHTSAYASACSAYVSIRQRMRPHATCGGGGGEA
jgi:hypothetical protein